MGSALGRFIALSLLIGTLLGSTAERIAEFCAPAFASEIQWLQGTFEVTGLQVMREGGELLFRMEVGLARPMTVGGKTFYPDPRGKATSSTLVANAVLPVALFLAGLFAIPAARARNHLLRVVVVVPGVVLITVIGVPLTLLANVWRIVYEAASASDYSLLLLWSDVVQDGGLNVLAIGCGSLLAYVIERAARTSTSSTPDHSGNGKSTCAALPNVPSVDVCSQVEKRGSDATMPPPIVPNS